jgi:ATP-dependent helicase/nuclease subunit A
MGLPSASGDDAVRRTAAAKQALVADPAISAWVSANAGTGKTHVLVRRVMRLLLSGAAADSILCLTFTKAAAAQMANRLMRELGGWAASSDAVLQREIATLLERTPTADELALARCLFARVLDSPGGLKIMTIHAFCERVLRRFPLEAGVPPSFAMLTEEEQSATLREAIEEVLREAAGDPGSELGRALTVAGAQASEDRFETLLETLVRKREDLRALFQYCGEHEPFAHIDHLTRKTLGVGRDESPEAILKEQAGLLSDQLISYAIGALGSGTANDQKTAVALGAIRGQTSARRVRALAGALLTKEGKPKADRSLVTNGISAAYPDVARTLFDARDRFIQLESRRHAATTAAVSIALIRLADAVIARYDAACAERSALDFDRLIIKTRDLLQRSENAAWVLYRLDADIAHLLVDEAQDTSPIQWELVKALTAEFFSGEAEKARTLFAVGDEKQSIYGFQGAEPKAFAEHGRYFAAAASAVDARWEHESFVVSRRSTAAVLLSVDLVFQGHAARGLTADGAAIRHEAHRIGEAGLVEVWPPVRLEKREGAPAWEPFAEEAGGADPCSVLAERIAKQIRLWLDEGEVLASEGRPITAGDILILVRKRKPFADRMVRALKEHKIPVAGADRMRLTEQLAVMDLMVLGDFLLLPEDDLALATLLKTPFFGFDDDDLFAIGYDRKGSLWQALHAKVPLKPAYGEAVAKLESWRSEARRRPPFDFYTARLEEDGLRRALLSRLGPDAADAITEFLNLALVYESGEPPSLQGFLHWLRVANPEIKRDMEQERDEVRVMTVHGAKGLEAPIVFLADTCAFKASDCSILSLPIAGAPPGAPKLPVWVLKGARRLEEIEKAREAMCLAEREEYHRLLYVAMTRARDRLYVGGFQNGLGKSKDCWWDLIDAGLKPHLVEALDDFGDLVGRFETAQTVPVAARALAAASRADAEPPDWLHRTARQEMAAGIVNPSRLVAGTAAIARDGERGPPPEAALLRGRLVHRLLEMLPVLPREHWERAGARLIASEGSALTEAAREPLLSGVAGILAEPDFAALFGPDGRAEVAIAAEIAGPDGAAVLLSGQIDRLIVREGDVLIVDYKTGAHIPASPELAPPAYIAQLAAYRTTLRRLFPGKAVRAALLWVDGPQMMEIPASLLEK